MCFLYKQLCIILTSETQCAICTPRKVEHIHPLTQLDDRKLHRLLQHAAAEADTESMPFVTTE